MSNYQHPPSKNGEGKDGQEDEEEKIVRPYRSSLLHPNMTWTDCVINWVFPIIIPLSSLASCEPKACKETIGVAGGMRKKSPPFMIKKYAKIWSDIEKCPIVESHCNVPVITDILTRWGICNQDDGDTLIRQIDDTARDRVGLVVRFPTSLLPCSIFHPPDHEKIGKENRFGFIKIADDFDLGSLPSDVTILVQYHGGGFVIGNAIDGINEPDISDLVMAHYNRAVRRSKPLNDTTEEETSKTSAPYLVTISVDYALAPEYPFPLGIIESLSVIEFLMASSPNRKIHLCGYSAGASIALVAGLEAARVYPGRVKSVQALAPYIDPKADSMSYYMMSTGASGFPGVKFLRWCWLAYLGMANDTAQEDRRSASKTKQDKKMTTMEKVLKEGSNATAWENCQWNKEPFRRLIRPIEGLGDLAKMSNACPALLVTVNKADPLYCEGMEFAEEAMKYGLPIELFQHNGLHVVGSTMTDRKGNAERLNAWASHLFGERDA